MTGMTEVPDDYVPPVLLQVFKDLEVLHHRLVAYGRVKDIAYIKWLTKAYEWALRVRRERVDEVCASGGGGGICTCGCHCMSFIEGRLYRGICSFGGSVIYLSYVNVNI
jgi:hypothetical protein